MRTLRQKIERNEQIVLEEKIRAMENALKENELPIPIEKIASLQSCQRPILDGSVYEQVLAGIATIKHADTWKKWGFQSSNSVLLFSGPSGTGKTTTARWVAKHLRKSLIAVSMGDFGGGDPGDSERNLARIFMAGEGEKAVIFFDECDAILWDRGQAGKDSMWMIGVINFILTKIETYDGTIILASNFAHILDAALRRRITFEVHFGEPSYESRKKLWVAKWPNSWPLPLPVKEIGNLANENLTGAEIEKVIEEEARFALTQERKPTLANIKRISHRISEEKAPSKS